MTEIDPPESTQEEIDALVEQHVRSNRRKLPSTNRPEWDLVRAKLRDEGLDDEDFGLFAPFSRFDDAAAVPVLMELLPQVKDRGLKETIVRHLTDKAAKPVAAPLLLDEFRKTPKEDSSLKWALGSALSSVCTSEHIPTLIQLATDKTHGMGRQEIVTRLGNGPKTEQIAQALIDLLGDEDVTLHAISALRRQLGNEAARPHVEEFLDHPSDRVKRQAKQQLKRIDKALDTKK